MKRYETLILIAACWLSSGIIPWWLAALIAAFVSGFLGAIFEYFLKTDSSKAECAYSEESENQYWERERLGLDHD